MISAPWTPALFDQLPLVLAGPILRRATVASVSVWVAVRARCTVELRLYDSAGQLIDATTSDTYEVGTRLHIACVTRTSPLQWGTTYQYDLAFYPTSGTPNAPAAGSTLLSSGVLSADPSSARRLVTYANEVPGAPERPTFALAPENLAELRLFHASCRRVNGESVDALDALDTAIQLSIAHQLGRPNVLALTGDQIYGDWFDEDTMAVCNTLASILLGWDEPFPLSKNGTTTTVPLSSLGATPRTQVLRDIGAVHKPTYQLLGLGEFCAMHLLVWSGVLWPSDRSGLVDGVRRFIEGVPQVRRALAHTPTYMIFDDHEITDNWNLTASWCTAYYGTSTGRRLTLNGLIAYWLFQAWGNDPVALDPHVHGAALTTWLASGAAGNPELVEGVIGIPDVGDETELAQARAAGLPFHYRVELPGCDLVALDERTWRAFRGDIDSPCELLPPEALAAQLPGKSASAKVTILLASTVVTKLPLPLIARIAGRINYWIEGFKRYGRGSPDRKRYEKVYGPARGDSFMAQSVDLERFFAALSERYVNDSSRRGRVVILSGDIHISFAARLQHWATRRYGASAPSPETSFVAALLTSSAARNEDRVKRQGHAGGYNLFSWMPTARQWLGWHARPSYVRVPDTVRLRLLYDGDDLFRADEQPPMLAAPAVETVSTEPDWRYRIDFLRGESKRPPSALPPQPAPGAPWMEHWQYAGKAYRAHSSDSSDGAELVGRNNIGEVMFEVVSGDPVAVMHTYWWRPSDDDSPGPGVQFRVSLGFQDAEYPRPAVQVQP